MAINLAYFDHGDYMITVEQKGARENVSKVLRPDDNVTVTASFLLFCVTAVDTPPKKTPFFGPAAALTFLRDSTIIVWSANYSYSEGIP